MKKATNPLALDLRVGGFEVIPIAKLFDLPSNVWYPSILIRENLLAEPFAAWAANVFYTLGGVQVLQWTDAAFFYAPTGNWLRPDHFVQRLLFRTIGFSDQEVLPREERETLWELAQLDRANAAVRDDLLKRWFKTAEAFTRGDARGGQGFRAVTGLNLEYHQLGISGATELGRHLATALESPQETDYDRLSSLGYALAALTAKMEPRAAAEIAKGLATALENRQETDSYSLSSLGKRLAAFCALLPSAHYTHSLNFHLFGTQSR